MIQLNRAAVDKVQEILDSQEPKPADCGFPLWAAVARDSATRWLSRIAPACSTRLITTAALKVFVDQASLLYLDGAEVDYVETLEGSGFKFNNPNVKSTCGCGSSFSA